MQEVAPALSGGRYRLLDVLGSGGMATVYRAWDSRLEVVRAIKVLSPHLTAQESLRARFESEARTMARLRHRNLVTIHDVDADGERVFMVMELVEGGSLMDLVQFRGRLGGAEALVIMEAVLEGLAAAHDKGVVHRDVKPHNVLLDLDGTPRLADFGIARVSDSGHTRTGAVMGTFAYMAPEQRTDARSVDARADVFAAGATLYVMVTGREPFDLYATGLEGEVFAGVEPEVAEVIKGATRYQAEERYPSAGAMLQALREARARLDPARQAALPVPEVEPLPLPDVSALPAVGEAVAVAEVATAELPSPTFTIEPDESDTIAPALAGATAVPSEDETPRRGLAALLAAGGAMAVVAAAGIVVLGGATVGIGWWYLRPTPELLEDPPPAPADLEPLDEPGTSEASGRKPFAQGEGTVRPDPEPDPGTSEASGRKPFAQGEGTVRPEPRPDAPPPAAPVKPTPPVEPVHVPPPPPSGHVDLSGAAASVTLVRGDETVPVPGDVPVGTWEIHARFAEGGDAVLAGQLTLVDGARVHLVCKAGFMRCAVE